MITDFIKPGKWLAVTRAQLCALTGMNDRQVRQEIEDARHLWVIINNDGDGKGYYFPTGIDEVEKQYKQNKKRFMSIAHYQKFLRRELKAAGRL